jgi:hypothetical protein
MELVLTWILYCLNGVVSSSGMDLEFKECMAEGF